MMIASKQGLDDLLSLSMQLNRQAFAQPPVEGWLNSFLTMLCERFAPQTVRGVQVVQVVGNTALQIGSAGAVPAEASGKQLIDESSPIAETLRLRQISMMPNAHIYPITVGSDPIGVLLAYFDVNGDNATILDPILGTLASQLGPAMMQSQKTPGPQTGRLMRQIDMMRSLYEATRNFNAALDSPDLLRRAARSLVETLHIDHVGIVVFDYKERIGNVISEFPDSGVVGMRIPMVTPLQERLENTLAPVVINNVDEAHDLGSARAMLQTLGIKSLAVLPMIVQDELIGSVGLDAFYEYHDFTIEEIEAATAVTSQLAVSAHNAQLYAELRRRANQLERIAEMSRRVTSTFDRGQIFQIAREETQKIIDCDVIVVALRNTDSPIMNMYILVDEGPIVADFPVERSALRFIFNTVEPLVLDDISGSDDPDYRLLTSSGMRAMAAVPLIAGGRVMGAYCVTHRDPGHYISIDLAVLEQIANQLAIALENARLYMQTLQRAETELLMNRLSGSIQGRGDLQSMVLGTVQEIAEALGARRARVRLEMPKKTSNDIPSRVAGKIIDKLADREPSRDSKAKRATKS
jgi:GAF domain-containing protein